MIFYMKKNYIIKVDNDELKAFNEIFKDHNLIHSKSTLVDDRPIVYGSYMVSKINAFLGNSPEHPLTLIRSSKSSFLSPIYCEDIVAVDIGYELISQGVYRVLIHCRVEDRLVMICNYLIKTHE